MSDNITPFNSLAIILPSLDPDYKFKAVVDGLVQAGFEHIVIVDDGSDEAHQDPFDYARTFSQCTVLVHEVNKGKGRALKDAFRYVYDNLPEVKGCVTIDGDGQHLLPDIIACGEKLLENPDKVILGCRDFDDPKVPPRSVSGNKTTRTLFLICYGIKITDTQTGLRGVSRQYLEAFTEIEGERFEYETNMLLQMKRNHIDFLEVQIATVYDEEDYSSHYNALKDSWRIFKIMFKYLASSLLSTVIDLGIFAIIFALIKNSAGSYATLISTVVARAVSSFFNFNANNAVVFQNKGNYKSSLLKYYALCIPQMLVSAGLVSLLNSVFNNSATLIATVIKFLVDTVLFFISYTIQREWVFSNKKK